MTMPPASTTATGSMTYSVVSTFGLNTKVLEINTTTKQVKLDHKEEAKKKPKTIKRDRKL